MNRTDTHNVAIGVFQNQADARQAIQELKWAGFSDAEIGVVAHDPKRKYHRPDTGAGAPLPGTTLAAEGAATGAMAGAGVGALWALGIAAGMLPAVGPVVAGGILSSIVLSAAGGATLAGLTGALIGLGIPEDEADFYEEQFRMGRTIITVNAAGRQEEAVAIMQQHNGYNLQSRTDVLHPSSTDTQYGSYTGRGRAVSVRHA